MFWTILILLPMFFSLPLAAQVRFKVGTDSVAIQVAGKPFSMLHFGKEARKPYLHPLLTVSGGPDPVTRGFPVDPLPGDSTDHPNHRGLYIGAEEVNGEDFLDNEPGNTEPPPKGNIEFEKLTQVTDGDERGTLSLLAHWISHEGKVWLIERRTMIFYGKPTNVRMFDIDTELEAAEPVTITDHQSAIIGLRLGLGFDTHYDGFVVNAAGGKNEEGVRGRRSPWLVWIGTTSGEGRVGVAMFDHPANLNYPCRWQVRDKGLLMANPFGGKIFAKFDPTAANENAEFKMKRGDKLRLRYRVLIYNAGKNEAVGAIVARMNAAQKEFAKQ
jgi:hypothetical protein